MQRHGPKRVYTPQSLEFWFGKLEHEWTGNFSVPQLEEGRRMYRDSEIREIELTDKDAIIHRKVEKKEEYAVIEWSADGFSVRSSSTDAELARAIAVAGLHEIEELVADEMSPLPGNLPPPVPTAESAAGNGAAGSGKANGVARPLVLVFDTKTEGLTFKAWWVNPDATRSSALGHANGNGNGHGNGNGSGNGNGTGNGDGASAAHVSSGERGKLICLTTYARKAHFRYQQESHVYVLDLLKEIPEFLRTTLPVWRRYFVIELDDNAANLVKGERAVEIEAHAEKGASVGLELRWIFRAGERLLTEEEVDVLSRRAGAAVILPSLGIVSLAPDKWESLHPVAPDGRGDGAGRRQTAAVPDLFAVQRRAAQGHALARDRGVAPERAGSAAGPAGAAGVSAPLPAARRRMAAPSLRGRAATACWPTRWAWARRCRC